MKKRRVTVALALLVLLVVATPVLAKPIKLTLVPASSTETGSGSCSLKFSRDGSLGVTISVSGALASTEYTVRVERSGLSPETIGTLLTDKRGSGRFSGVYAIPASDGYRFLLFSGETTMAYTTNHFTQIDIP